MKKTTQHSKAALVWIMQILNELDIPYQIAGGLAAKAYGASRSLNDIDIDIPEDKFEILKEKVSEFIIFGPSHFKDEYWDLLLMTLNYQGQEIDLSGAHEVKVFNKSTGKWHNFATDFSRTVPMEIFGLNIPVIRREELVAYKKILAREVDISDINEIENAILPIKVRY